MATKNPRVVSYISPEDHEQLQQFMKERNLTESRAIAAIINAYFGGTPEALSRTPSTPADVVERITAVEEQVAELRAALGELVA